MKINEILNEMDGSGSGRDGSNRKSHSTYGSRDKHTVGNGPDIHLGPKSLLSRKDATKKMGDVLNREMKKSRKGVAEGSNGVSVRGWANQVRKDHGTDIKFVNRKEGGGAVDTVRAINSQGETVGVYNRKTGYPTVFEPKQGVAEGSHKCTCNPGDADPDCAVHGLEPMEVGDALDEGSLNEFANDDFDDRPKFIPWNDFIEGVKGIVGKEFEAVEKVVKSTIQARFVPHDALEYGPTMLYSYYEARAGRGKGAVSTRGSIQVGSYYPNSTALGTRNYITSFNLLKGHPFERHFDLTPENISKIASIILGNTEGAYKMTPQGKQMNEFAPPGGDDGDDGDDGEDIKLPYYDSTAKTIWRDGISKGKKQRFANFRAVDTGRAWAIVGDTLKDGSVKISVTPSKDLAQYLVSAYQMRNQA
jgi:hypothetical protein